MPQPPQEGESATWPQFSDEETEAACPRRGRATFLGLGFVGGEQVCVCWGATEWKHHVEPDKTRDQDALAT